MNKKETVIKNQRGMASIVIVILIMTFLSLIVLAMTRNSNREQRQALDRQLSSQAFYAAESGINDAKKYLADTPSAPDKKDTCDPVDGAAPGDQFPGQTSRVGPVENDSIRYSCVLYNTVPEVLIKEVSTTESWLAPIEDADGRILQSLTFSWRQPTGDSLDFSGCLNPASSSIPATLGDNCNVGGLRTELIDPDSSITDRETLIRNNFLAYLMPSSSAAAAGHLFASASGAANKQGQLWKGGCSANTCSLTINTINKKTLLLHIRSIYKNNTVTITGKAYAPTPSGTANIKFKGAQVMIDSTGHANDVSKTIQVYDPASVFTHRTGNPEFSLQTSDDICKLLNVLPPSEGMINVGACSL